MPELEFIDPFAPKGKVEPVQAASDRVSVTESHSNGVPKGSSKEVLKWVSDDPERAQQALDAELADDRPRKGLLGELQELVDKAADDEAPVADAGDAGGNQPKAEEKQPGSNNDPTVAEAVTPPISNNADTGPDGGEALSPDAVEVEPGSNNAPSSPDQAS